MKHGCTRAVLAAFFLSLPWVTGCGGEEPRLTLLPEDAVVLAFGDSLTRGTGAGQEQAYPQVLATLIDRQVINAGIPGEVSAAGAERLPGLLEKHRPALVVLCHGGNDILRKLDRQALRANLERMIADSGAAGAEVVLIGVPDFGLILDTADIYRQVEQATGVLLEPDLLPDILQDRESKSDPIHPNGKGYRLMAEGIAELLRREGAILGG